MKSSPNAKTQTLSLRRGLAVIRYTSAQDEQAPLVRLERQRGAAIEQLSEPGGEPWQLDQAGQCLVLKVSEPSEVVVQIVPLRASRAQDVVVTVEYLTAAPEEAREVETDDNLWETAPPRKAVEPAPARRAARVEEDDELPPVRRRAARSEPVAQTPAPPAARGRQKAGSAPQIRVLGHVSRLGDRVVAGGEWIAGPDRPLPVEGLKIDLAATGLDLTLRYAVGAGESPRLGAMRDAGTFVGTRGRSLPLTAVALELAGEDAERFELTAEALFFGAPRITRAGRRIKLQGPAHREALLGLRLGLRGVNPAADEGPEWHSTGRKPAKSKVLIFR